MYPHPKARLFEQQRCDQAHHRAHDAHDHQRDGVSDELRAVCGAHKQECQLRGQLFHHKKFQHKGHRHHDRHFVQSHNKSSIGHAVCVQRHIVDDHAIDHDSGHDNGKEDAFR